MCLGTKSCLTYTWVLLHFLLDKNSLILKMKSLSFQTFANFSMLLTKSFLFSEFAFNNLLTSHGLVYCSMTLLPFFHFPFPFPSVFCPLSHALTPWPLSRIHPDLSTSLLRCDLSLLVMWHAMWDDILVCGNPGLCSGYFGQNCVNYTLRSW